MDFWRRPQPWVVLAAVVLVVRAERRPKPEPPCGEMSVPDGRVRS